MKVLIFESTPATPHPETALEVAARECYSGSEVIYCPFFQQIPSLIWRSNINGRQSNGISDSLTQWLEYLTEQIAPFAEVDVSFGGDYGNDFTDGFKNDLFNFVYDNHPFGELVKSNVVQISNSIDVAQFLQNNRGLCEDLARTAIISYNIARCMINKHDPDLVYIFNGRTVSTWPIFKLCGKMDVKCLIHERGADKDKYSVWDGPPQYQQVLKEAITHFSKARDFNVSRLSAALYYSRQKNGRIKNYGFNNTVQNHLVPVDISGLKNKFVAYYTTSNYEMLLMPGQDVTNRLGSQVAAVAALAKVCQEEGIQLIIKMHPGTPRDDWASFDQFRSEDHCLIIYPDSSVSSYLLGEMAYRNISYGSTITWEFIYAGTACAVLSNTVGRNEPGFMELDCEEDIRDYLRHDLHPVDKYCAVKFADFMANYGEKYELYRPISLFSGVFDSNLN
jgi:hypothetical protein